VADSARVGWIIGIVAVLLTATGQLFSLRFRKAVTAGALTVDPARRQARVGEREIELTVNEFELLYLLAAHRGIVFSREALMERIWGNDTHITERSVDTLVKRVRRKVEADPAEPQFILTVWGTGYKFADV